METLLVVLTLALIVMTIVITPMAILVFGIATMYNRRKKQNRMRSVQVRKMFSERRKV